MGCREGRGRSEVEVGVEGKKFGGTDDVHYIVDAGYCTLLLCLSFNALSVSGLSCFIRLLSESV